MLKYLKSLGMILLVNSRFFRLRSFISFSTKVIAGAGAKIETGYGSRVRDHGEIFLGQNAKLFLGNHATIMRLAEVVVTDFATLTLEDSVYIGSHSNIRCHKNITIGKGTKIAQFVSIFGGQYDYRKKDNITYQNFKPEDVTIGQNVWVGANAVILSGVKIGDGAVVGAGSIVTKDIPEFAIAVGNPAKVIGFRD